MYIYISYIHICLGSRACPNDLVQRQPSERCITLKSQKGHSRWHVPSGLQSEGGTRGFVGAERSLKTFCFSFLERVITFNPPVTVLSFSLFSRRREGHKARATKSLNLTVGLLIHIYSTWRIWYKTIHYKRMHPMRASASDHSWPHVRQDTALLRTLLIHVCILEVILNRQTRSGRREFKTLQFERPGRNRMRHLNTHISIFKSWEDCLCKGQ